MAIFTLTTCALISARVRSVHVVMSALTRTLGWNSSTSTRPTRRNFAHTTPITSTSVSTRIFAPLPTIKQKYAQSSSITMSLMRTSTCFTTKLNSVPSISPNTIKPCAFMPTISRTIAEIHPTIPMSPYPVTTGNSRTISTIMS